MKPKITSHINTSGLLTQLTTSKAGDNRTFFCAHAGPSMNPTLNAKDLLGIEAYREKMPKTGDVILFRVPQKDYQVVHRITRICSRGIQTRGDNNSQTDPWYLQPVDICGRVITAHRGAAVRIIINGFMGRIIGLYCQLRRCTLSSLTKTLSPVYRSLCANSFLRLFVPTRLHPKVVTFTSQTHSSHRLLLGKTIIGTYDHAQQQWQIRHPYRLLVNESLLPTPR
jgi:signal peptidase I